MMFDLEAEEARLLLKIALMAVGGNRFQSAAKIFAALEKFRPNSSEVASGKAVALMSAGMFAEAAEYVEGTALARFPDTPMLQAFLGMALLRLGRVAEAAEPLEKAASQSVDSVAAKMAGDLLNS